MQNKTKQSHTATNFYLAVTILIIAIGVSVGYAVNRHYVLQEMIQKSHVPDSPIFHFLEETSLLLAPVDKVLTPFKPIISVLFTILLLELGGQLISPLLPKRLKSFTKSKKETLLQKMEARIKSWIQRLRDLKK